MKRFTYAQILKAFAKATANAHRFNDILESIANAPFYKTIINLKITFTVNDGSDHHWFQVPVNILVNDVDIKRSILKEIATQIFKYGELDYYKDEPPVLEFEDINLEHHGVYSFDNHTQYAIFHEEQECGCSWFTIDVTTLSAPFTYEHDYSTNAIRRSETNSVVKQYVNRKR